ncbi:MAG TPA: RodZ domain-containing protein [Planococcus sp. (in: firmicutes)]|nr:RodZ domain-containing protein [Planococcus sp. (in: firmicutes)]
MSDLGTRLKEARVAKGYSLEDLQEATKIQKRYLSSIEEGDFSAMPGSFYARAFIKRYAEAVDLNPDEVLERHKAELPMAAEEDSRSKLAAPTPSRRRTMSKRSSSQLGEAMPKIIVGLFIIVILFIVFFFYQNLPANTPEEDLGAETGVPYEGTTDDEAEGVVEEEEAEEEEAVEEEVVEEEPVEESASLEAVETAGETSTFTWTGPENRELEIEASGESWVTALDENQEELLSEARVLQADESETLDLSDVSQVWIRIGATENITLTLNGEEVEYTQDRTTQNIVIQFTDSE